jgi:predicted O-methyltransferase YrrM
LTLKNWLTSKESILTSRLGERKSQHLAVDIIPTLDVKFDLVFIDADKKTTLTILISFCQNE